MATTDTASSGQPAQSVVAIRRDGLGQRLLAILYAMHLAELLDVGYRFVWAGVKTDHHAVPRASELFQNDYLAAHVLGGVPRGLTSIGKTSTGIRALRASGLGTNGWLMRSGAALRGLPARERAAKRGYYRRLFDRIGFMPTILEAIAAADRVELPEGVVALHLRAGDIIYGRFRFTDQFTDKVVCLPVARRMIDVLVAEGRPVLLFSQDPAAAERLRQTPGVTIAADHVAHLGSAIEKALFEVALMSRCHTIYAGNSAFAILAGRIGDRPVLSPNAFFSTAEQVRIIDEDLAQGRCDGDPPLQVAFAAWTAAHLQAWNPAEAIRRLKTAIRHDPVNGFYRLKLATHLLVLERISEARAVLQDVVSGEAAVRNVAARALAEKTPAGVPAMATDRLILEQAVRQIPAVKSLLADAGAAGRAAARKVQTRLKREAEG